VRQRKKKTLISELDRRIATARRLAVPVYGEERTKSKERERPVGTAVALTSELEDSAVADGSAA